MRIRSIHKLVTANIETLLLMNNYVLRDVGGYLCNAWITVRYTHLYHYSYAKRTDRASPKYPHLNFVCVMIYIYLCNNKNDIRSSFKITDMAFPYLHNINNDKPL